jgi:Zn finger protein HypA/HybF involved in hydrogenase expression
MSENTDASPSGGIERTGESIWCIYCEEKFAADEAAESAECPHCGRENDLTQYGDMERLRDSILDANGLMGDCDA